MAPIDRKGRDVRQGKHEDRLRRDTFQYEVRRISSSLEAGQSPADIDVPVGGPWPSSEYEARHY